MVSDAQRFGYLCLLGFLVWPFLAGYGPILEGYLAPVITHARITQVREDGPTHSIIYGRFTKFRNCKFVRLEWQYGDVGGASVSVPLVFIEKTKIRSTGEHQFGPWRINLEKALVRGDSFAYAYHRCHPFWETRTVFYMPPGQRDGLGAPPPKTADDKALVN